MEARYGNPKSKATAAIDRALRSGAGGKWVGSPLTSLGGGLMTGTWPVKEAAQPRRRDCLLTLPVLAAPSPGDAGLVGVGAQLGTVDDRQLSAVLAAALRGHLATLVVADAAARQRLAAALAEQRYPAPDMLPMSMLLPYGGKSGDSPGFAGAGERAHALQRAACRGADPPLALALPHTRAISQLRDKGAWVPLQGGGACTLCCSRRHACSTLTGAHNSAAAPLALPPQPRAAAWGPPTGRAAAWAML